MCFRSLECSRSGSPGNTCSIPLRRLDDPALHRNRISREGAVLGLHSVGKGPIQVPWHPVRVGGWLIAVAPRACAILRRISIGSSGSTPRVTMSVICHLLKNGPLSLISACTRAQIGHGSGTLR
jgi:hypothetical protein